MFDPMTPDPSVLERMRRDWDERARENARHFIANERSDWSEEEFFNSGRLGVFHEVLTDLRNVCQSRNPKDMTVLEIGCGAGRMTMALSEVFGQVYAVDVSGEMIALARPALAPRPNAHVYQNNGADLRVLDPVLGAARFDFAFSYIVFQHIPSKEVIYSYLREVHRLLRPGALFKFQVHGAADRPQDAPDTWNGVSFSDADAVEMAEQCGFEPRHRIGPESQYFWLWFFRR